MSKVVILRTFPWISPPVYFYFEGSPYLNVGRVATLIPFSSKISLKLEQPANVVVAPRRAIPTVLMLAPSTLPHSLMKHFFCNKFQLKMNRSLFNSKPGAVYPKS